MCSSDLAHLTPPFVGQGMNSGVRDAHNLSWKLAAVLRGQFGQTLLDTYKEEHGYVLDTDLTAADWQAVIVQYKALVERELGKPFPQDPKEQLWGAIGAVFGSWMNARAITYRQLHDIPASWGTAVNVQIGRAHV